MKLGFDLKKKQYFTIRPCQAVTYRHYADYCQKHLMKYGSKCDLETRSVASMHV